MSTPANPTLSIHSTSTLTEPTQDVEKGKEQPSSATAPPPPPANEFLVTLEGREHLNPHSWSENYRWGLTCLAGILLFNATFASAAPAGLIPSIVRKFHVGSEVGTLLIAIFVAGYCVGPLLWGPLSERYGRRSIFIVSWIPYIGFQIGCALSPNIGALIVFRFLSGCFSAAPLTNSGGVIMDIWPPARRGVGMAIFGFATFSGPTLAPLISGYMAVAGVDSAWIFWVLTIVAGLCLIAIVAFLPETFVPYILYKEAHRLRKETGDDRWTSALEESSKQSDLKSVLKRTILKPCIMFFEEPMLAVLTLYMSLVYGLFYLLIEAVPIIFIEQHGLNAGESGAVFLSLLTGGAFAALVLIFYFNPKYVQLIMSLKGQSPPPEARLSPLKYSAILLPICFFWVGWTSYPSISIASPIIALSLFGVSMLWMFMSILTYCAETYLANAASALAIVAVIRSFFGAGFPMFSTQMIHKLSVPGACSLLGGIAIIFMPIPFILTKYGKKIRGMSKNAMNRG